MASKWRWCANCRRWFYPDRAKASAAKARPRCPVCQRESLSAEEAPGTPPRNGEDR
jgi:hypothetical protein